ncbi:hypothetical protein [Microcoleus sp. FACHB-831]|nr:hypothetical protein [Microcoleus sp. FACHB-831]
MTKITGGFARSLSSRGVSMVLIPGKIFSSQFCSSRSRLVSKT